MKKKVFKTLGRLLMIGMVLRVLLELQTEVFDLRSTRDILENKVRGMETDRIVDISRLRDIFRQYNLDEALIEKGVSKEDLDELKRILEL